MYINLCAYFFIYSFFGWLTEVLALTAAGRRFSNRGFFNLPLAPSYGVTMVILLILMPSVRNYYILQFVVSLAVSSVVNFVSGFLSKKLSRLLLWHYEENSIFGGKIYYSLLLALGFMCAVLLIHPLVFMLVSLVPEIVTLIVCIVLSALLVIDFVFVLLATHKPKNLPPSFGEKLYNTVLKRLKRAYPHMEAVEKSGKPKVFAEGVCFDKLIWVFVITAFIGDIIETFYCRAVGGVWMSRSSVIYGPFSVVWGFGAVLLTIIFQKLIGKEDRYIFFLGCVVGGVYEYFCSVFTEVFLGTTFWDYSDMPLNIGGRTNLLFCFFWGILSVVWIKLLYPKISAVIEKTHPLAGKIATWVLLVLMVCDTVISASAMLRYTDRLSSPEPNNAIEEFLDENYPNELIEKVWPNMILSK